MRLGLIIYGDLDTISGGYLYDRKLVAHLRGQGDEVAVFSLSWRHYLAHLRDNVSRALLTRLQEAPLDILLQDELNHPSLAWLNRRLRRSVSYPIVSIVHHLRCSETHRRWQNWLYRQVERRYLQSVDAFIYNSRTTRQAVTSLLGDTRPAIVAYPAGDRWGAAWTAPQVAARGQASGPLRLLFVGNLIPRKGLHVLLEALTALPLQQWRLQVVGADEVEPRYTARVRAQVRRLGLSGAVSFRGLLDDAALQQEYQRSHILVVPSLYEGFGIVYLEAFAFGLPVIASTAGGAGEVVQDDVNGYLIAPGDVATLRRRLQRLARDREQLIRLGTAALQSYRNHPTWTQTTAHIRTFLLLLAQGERPRPSRIFA